jgi:hypothetical protein
MEFIDGIDTDYYDFLCRTYLDCEDKKRASIALRSAYLHALETFFSLLGATVQAPQAAYAWIAKCNNSSLRSFVNRINSRDKTLYTRLNFQGQPISWELIAGVIFDRYMAGTDKQKRTIESFAKLWARLASEFIDDNYIDEYNSIKHGFRVRSGGFTIAIGREKERGVSPPPSEMEVIGGSEHGTSFFKINPVKDVKGNRNLTSRRTSINWKIEKLFPLLQLLSVSIANVTSALKYLNGVPATDCQFFKPEDDSFFDVPWQYEPGVPWTNFDVVFDTDCVPVLSKKQLFDRLDTV